MLCNTTCDQPIIVRTSFEVWFKTIEAPAETITHKMNDTVSIFTGENFLVHQCGKVLSEIILLTTLKISRENPLMLLSKKVQFTVCDEMHIKFVNE